MRDQIVEARLEAAKWNVLTIWECKLKKDAFETTMARLSSTLLQNREKWLAKADKRKAAETARKEALLAGMDIPAKIKSLAEQEMGQ